MPNTFLHLKNILHVPAIAANLLSVHKIARSRICSIKFDANKYYIQDKENRVIAQGPCGGGIYPITSSMTNKTGYQPQKTALHTRNIKVLTWHHRLGHPSTKHLNFILKNLDLPFSQFTNCNSCDLAKSHELHLPRSLSVTKSPLDLIHSDVWGPL